MPMFFSLKIPLISFKWPLLRYNERLNNKENTCSRLSFLCMSKPVFAKFLFDQKQFILLFKNPCGKCEKWKKKSQWDVLLTGNHSGLPPDPCSLSLPSGVIISFKLSALMSMPEIQKNISCQGLLSCCYSYISIFYWMGRCHHQHSLSQPEVTQTQEKLPSHLPPPLAMRQHRAHTGAKAGHSAWSLKDLLRTCGYFMHDPAAPFPSLFLFASPFPSLA